MMWYKKVGFYSNPFSIKPAAFHDEVIGQNLKMVMEKVDDGGFVFIKGEYGTGKTSVLKRIINRYKGKGKLIYINLEFLDEVKVEELLKKRAGFFQRMFGRLPKEAVLLVDEAQLIKKNISEDIYNFFDEGFIKSVVFVGTDLNKKSLSSDVEKRLHGNFVSLKTLTPQNAIKIVRKRIGSVLLSDNVITEIFSYSQNPRIFLENCEDVCKYAIDAYSSQVDSEHVKAVLGKKKTRIKKRIKKRKEAKIEKEAVKEVLEKKEKTENRKKVEKKEKKKEGKLKRSYSRKKEKKEESEKKGKTENKDEVEKKDMKEEERKKEEKGKEGKREIEDKEIEFYVDTEGYPEYTFKQEF